MVPEHDCPCPVFSFGDCPFKGTVFYRMVLNVNRKSFFRRLETGAFRRRPTLENPVKLQSKVVMQMAGSVFLNYIKIARRTRFDLPPGFQGVLETVFFMIRFKSHRTILPKFDSGADIPKVAF
jgi:hypothetical protein